MSFRIGIDVDGVLVDFNRGFSDFIRAKQSELKILKNHKHLPVVSHKEMPKYWDWSAWYPTSDDPIKSEELALVWKELFKTRNWWMQLPPLGGLNMKKLISGLTGIGAEIYFITVRPDTAGYTAQQQTAFWLIRQGWSHPSVIVAGNKGDVVRSLRLHLMVEDNAQNVMEIATATGGNTKILLTDFPYNRHQAVDGDIIRRIGKPSVPFTAEDIIKHAIDVGQQLGLLPQTTPENKPDKQQPTEGEGNERMDKS